MSTGGASGGKCGESWEFDSGARDLSPEPNTLQRLVEAAGCSLTATNTASLLQLANKLHLAALASLRGEILELTTRLHTVTQERDVLERAVAQAENSVAQQYEERLTELHSVIAELSRKMERQRTLVIAEEEDVPSGYHFRECLYYQLITPCYGSLTTRKQYLLSPFKSFSYYDDSTFFEQLLLNF